MFNASPNQSWRAPPPNCCKRLTKRRLFARRPVGRLEQSALGGGALSAKPFSKRRKKRAAVSVAVFGRFAIYANVVSRTQSIARHRCTRHAEIILTQVLSGPTVSARYY